MNIYEISISEFALRCERMGMDPLDIIYEYLVQTKQEIQALDMITKLAQNVQGYGHKQGEQRMRDILFRGKRADNEECAGIVKEAEAEMNTREEQIAEMAKDIYTTGVAIDGTDIAYGVFDNDDHFHRMANALYAAGYRKQRDTVREFVEKVLKIGSKRPLCLFNEYGEGYIDCIENIKKVAKEYGVEVKE